jgi:2-polyprenyl-3-methyl-5-hydroxy-6-metoxy-1,4-benzoquinol methylase
MGEDKSKEIVNSWRANATAWTDAIRQGNIASRKLVTNEAIVAAVVAAAPVRVLDMGCGEGWLVRALQNKGMMACGTDVSPELIEYARQASGGEYKVLGYKAFCLDPLLAGSDYDVVVFNFALLDENIVPILEAVKKVMNKTGLLVIQTVHPFAACGEERYEDGWRTEEFNAFGGKSWQPMPWYFRTVASWLQCLAAAGFEVSRVQEPLHPETGMPVSLLLQASVKG